jgi:peroxiredoxin
MLKTRFEGIVLLVLAALLGGTWLVLSREQSSGPDYMVLAEAPLVGHLAPDFSLPTADSHSHSLGTYRGQPVVLNFWATWCAPCRIEMPHLQTASENFNGRVAFLGVNDGEGLSLVTDFADELGLTYPLLLDDGRSVSLLYDIRSLPTTLFINRDGTVAEVIIGTINQAVLEDRIEKLLEADS